MNVLSANITILSWGFMLYTFEILHKLSLDIQKHLHFGCEVARRAVLLTFVRLTNSAADV